MGMILLNGWRHTTPPSGFNWDALSAESPTEYSGCTGTILVENKSFTNLNSALQNGTDVKINGSCNITFRNCYFGPSFSVGIYAVGFTGTLVVEDCLFNSNAGGILVESSTNPSIQVNNCEFVNPHGGRNCRGQMIQFSFMSTSNSFFTNCRGESFRGEGYTEDWISSFSTSGTVGNPIIISGNKVRGGGPSPSGGGFIAGDGDGNYITIENNYLKNPGNYIVAAAGGGNIIVRNNYGWQGNFLWTNIACYTYITNASTFCSNITMTGNHMGFYSGSPGNYYCYCTPNCGDVIGVTEGLPSASDGWRATNFDDQTEATIDAFIPAQLITFVTPDRLKRIRKDSVQFVPATGAMDCSTGPDQLHRPTAVTEADKAVSTVSTTINSTGSASTNGFNYQWVQVSGPNTATLTNATTATLTVSDIIDGVYEFRLDLSDNNGAMDFDWTTITVGIGTTFYVSPTGSDANNGLTTGTPWQTISKVNATNFVPGDTILFKKGGTYSGTILMNDSGTLLHPITVSNYDTGTLPQITSDSDFWSPLIAVSGASYVVIDGFKVIDATMSESDHSIQANFAYGVQLNNAPNCTIKNCDISRVGTGLIIQGTSNNSVITGNAIYNTRMIVNTVGGDDDYGANGIILTTSGNTITYNTFTDCWGNSNDYGFDGGVVEFFGDGTSNNIIMYNIATNCNGFLEVGSGAGGVSDNNIVAYNKVINCGTLGILNNSAAFAVDINNLQYYNNTIIETVQQFTIPGVMFDAQSVAAAGTLVLKNNVFWTTNSTNIFTADFAGSAMVHTNNYYRMTNGLVGVTLDVSEVLSSVATIFITTTGDPSTWNLRPANGSVLINFGTAVGYTNDFEGTVIAGNPDGGAYEYTAY